MLMKHKQKCGVDNITTTKTSNESHLHWKNHFHKNPLYFRIYADFEADNEKDNSSIGSKTTNFYKQNPILNGYRIVSELRDVLQSGFHKSPLGYNNVDWFVDEVLKLENKLAFYFRNTKKDIVMTEENDEVYRNNNICRFCEKNSDCDKIRDHCHLTGNYSGPAHSKSNNNVTQDKVILYHSYFTILVILIVTCFLRSYIIKRMIKLKFDILPKTNEEYVSETYGCIRFIDSYRFQSSSLDSLVKTLLDNTNKTLKTLGNEIVDNIEILNIVDEIVEDDKTTKNLKKDYPDKIKNLEEALLIIWEKMILRF